MFKAFRDALIWKIFGFYGLLSSHGVTVKQLLTLAEFFA